MSPWGGVLPRDAARGSATLFGVTMSEKLTIKSPWTMVWSEYIDELLGQIKAAEKAKRWKKTKYKVPTMRVFKDTAEIRSLIERDHQAECAMYRAGNTST